MPINLRAVHLCSGSGASVCNMMMPVFFALVPACYRHRFQSHSGTDTEIIHGLASYGVLSENVTPRLGGTYDDDEFRQWLHEERRKERLMGGDDGSCDTQTNN